MDNSREVHFVYRQILCTLVFVILIVRTVSEYPYNQCAHCECCAGACDVSNNYACDDAGCIAGYWGIPQCLHRCFDDEPCLTCGQRGGLWCYACNDGYYVPTDKTDENAHCTLTCNSNCETCIASSTNCQICKDGYANIGDSTDCRFTCPSNCETCSEKDVCSGCKAGFNDVSNQCNACVTGKYGLHCSLTCSSNCKGNRCDRDTGVCTDGCVSEVYVGPSCDNCVNGRFGEDCINCPTHCLNKKCERDNGECTDGCDSNVITGERCDTCVDGRFGDLCEHECPSNCKDNICNRTNGTCILGCEIYFVGNTCEQCVPGKYGNDCLLDCPVNCLNGVCSKESGVCLVCKENFSGDRCDTCTEGLYGTACSEECSVKCLHQRCNKETGHCLACENNRFGYECENLCPLTCRRTNGKTACDVSDGTCLLECEIGLYGKTCQKTCQRTCVNQACNFDTGICSLGCITGFNGEYCISEDTTSTAPTYGVLGVQCLTIGAIIVMAVYIWRLRRNLEQNKPMKQADHAQFANIPTETSELQCVGTVDSSVSSYELLDMKTVVGSNIYSNIDNEN